MILKYRGIAYTPEQHPAISQSKQTLQFLGQPYSAMTSGRLQPKPKAYCDRLQFLGQRYPLPAALTTA